jgi:hypothetical protein
VVVCRSSSRPSLARRPVFSQLDASPTSFALEEPPHDKSLPRTTSLRHAREVRLRLVHGPRRVAQASPSTRTEERISTSRGNNRLRSCRRPTPPRALMLA